MFKKKERELRPSKCIVCWSEIDNTNYLLNCPCSMAFETKLDPLFFLFDQST